MAQVGRDKKYTRISELLVNKETDYCSQKILPGYYSLMVFSAMIGFHFGEKSKVIDKSNEIKQETFENTQSDIYVYLCALQDQKSGEIFRECNENECWKIFESYANSGLEIIDNWLLDTPGDIDGVDTILNEMKKTAAELLNSDESEVDLGGLEF
jgi:dnd system-associated protein 4